MNLEVHNLQQAMFRERAGGKLAEMHSALVLHSALTEVDGRSKGGTSGNSDAVGNSNDW